MEVCQPAELVPNSQGGLCSMQVADVLFGCLFSFFLIKYAVVGNIDHLKR